MPFVSEKQRRYFYHKAETDPKWAKTAERWEAETKGDLPERVSKHKSKKRVSSISSRKKGKRYTYYKRYKQHNA